MGYTGTGTSGYVETANSAGTLPSFQVGSGFSASPIFLAQLSTTQDNVTGEGTSYTIVYDSIIENIGSAYNSSTGEFTAPYTGLYSFTICTTFYQIMSGNTFGSIVLSGTGISRKLWDGNPYNVSDADGTVGTSGTTIINLTSGDTVKTVITVSNNATKNIAVYGDLFQATSFMGYFLVST